MGQERPEGEVLPVVMARGGNITGAKDQQRQRGGPNPSGEESSPPKAPREKRWGAEGRRKKFEPGRN